LLGTELFSGNVSFSVNDAPPQMWTEGRPVTRIGPLRSRARIQYSHTVEARRRETFYIRMIVDEAVDQLKEVQKAVRLF
jgi:hypothetical protein